MPWYSLSSLGDADLDVIVEFLVLDLILVMELSLMVILGCLMVILVCLMFELVTDLSLHPDLDLVVE